MNIIIAGIQGSGKGTQSKLLADHFGLVHISFGDVIKWMLKEKPEIVAPYSIEKYNNGELAPDEVLFKVANYVIDPILEASDKYNGFILDGFPRTEGQMKFVLDSYDIDKCILLELEESIAIDRMLLRGRSDDTPDGIKRRIKNYRLKTEPTFKVLENDGKLIKLDANKSVFELNIELINELT
jgi:adenylate kinase